MSSSTDVVMRLSRSWRWIGDGEPVALVADALQQVERLGLPRQPDRLGPAGQEHLLELLRERRHRDLVAQAEFLEHPDGAVSCPLPPSTSSSCGG